MPEPNPNNTNENKKSKNILTENNSNVLSDKMFNEYLNKLEERNSIKVKSNAIVERAEVYDKSLLINDEFSKMIGSLEEIIENKEIKEVDE